jgi:(2Fe-2S) ferredoxin
MKQDQNFYDFHFFVCTNQKENGKDCASKGSAELFSKLKDWSRNLKPEDLKGKKIRVNKAGCLNRCAEGIACVAYPKAEWIVEVNGVDDLETLETKILKMLGEESR